MDTKEFHIPLQIPPPKRQQIDADKTNLLFYHQSSHGNAFQVYTFIFNDSIPQTLHFNRFDGLRDSLCLQDLNFFLWVFDEFQNPVGDSNLVVCFDKEFDFSG